MKRIDGASLEIEAARIQGILEETLDRLARQPEEVRVDALASAIQAELSAIPAERHKDLMDLLGALNVEHDTATARDGTDPGSVRAKGEVARLRAEVDALRTATTAAPGRFADQVATVLLGSGREAARLLAEDPHAEEKLLEQLRVIMRFVAVTGRSFLSATAEPDTTMSGQIESALASEISGRAPAGSFAALLDQIQHQIGGQLYAFREACDTGAQNLLRQLSPAAIAGESARESVSVVGWRPFSAREQWERFEQKFDALRRADNIFETYFDGAFRKAVLRVTRQGEERGGGRSREE